MTKKKEVQSKQQLSYQDLISQSEPFGDFKLLTPQVISTFSGSQKLALAIAIHDVMISRYGSAHKDKSISDPYALAHKIGLADFQNHPDQQAMYVWLAGKNDQAGFVTTIVDFGNRSAKLEKSAKSPSSAFKELKGGTIMKSRIPFILDYIPHISYFFVDSRAANIASVTASVQSPYLVPCGLETKHYSLLEEDKRIVQDGSVIMLGLRHPDNIPRSQLFVGKNTKSEKFIRLIVKLMHVKWAINPFTINPIEPTDYKFTESNHTEDLLTIRSGDYASARIKQNVHLPQKDIIKIIQETENDIFSQKTRYLTFEFDLSDPTSIIWQEELEKIGYVPTRFWPPIDESSYPILRLGILHPQMVNEVFELNLPTDFASIPYPSETSDVFNVLHDTGIQLIGKRIVAKEAFA